jgi:hypothetical protein
MKTKTLLFISALVLLLSFQKVKSQDAKNFPFDPYIILKSWNYDLLVKTMGNGEEIMATRDNQSYLAGLRYSADLFGMHGKLDFTFNKDSIASFLFRSGHKTRVTSVGPTDKKSRDPNLSAEYTLAIQKLDSVQRMDSLSRDSVVKVISKILGPAFSNGPTPVTEKNARHLAIWVNRGYTCLYKDFIDYSEIGFSLPTVPLWVVGEFDIPTRTEILQKTTVNTKKMSWAASLLGVPSNTPQMIYSDIFLLLEYTTGQKFLESVQKNSIGFLPGMAFQDCDGDAIPDAWIQVPSNKTRTQIKHYLFSLQYKEPNPIFNSDDLIPSDISILGGSRITVTFQDGTTRTIDCQVQNALPGQVITIKAKGFKYLNSTNLNTDGTTNFIGGIELYQGSESSGIGILEIGYKHTANGWEPEQVKFVKPDK